jgi:hypothetical protein
MTTTSRPTFDLATAVVTDGLAPHAAAIADLVAAAYLAGVRPGLVSLLSDRSQPDVARMRALGRVLAELDRVSSTPAHLAAA